MSQEIVAELEKQTRMMEEKDRQERRRRVIPNAVVALVLSAVLAWVLVFLWPGPVTMAGTIVLPVVAVIASIVASARSLGMPDDIRRVTQEISATTSDIRKALQKP